MKRNIVINSLAGLMILCMSNTVSAALFNFNQSNLGIVGDTTHDVLEMKVDGISVNVTAYTIENNGSGDISQLTAVGNGNGGIHFKSGSDGSLGVKSSSSSSDDGSKLDGGSSRSDLDEGLLFSFDTAVHLDYIDFDYFRKSEGDDFNLTIDGVTVLWDYNDDVDSPLVTNADEEFDKYTFVGSELVGREFLVWADGSSDAFRVDEFRVSAVPVPASLWLFGTALVGLGFNKRRAVF